MIPTSMELLGVMSLALFHVTPGVAPDLHNHAALVTSIRKLESNFPDRVEVFHFGESLAGRELLGLRITSGKETPPAQPAILLVAGLDGARAYTSSMAIDHATRLVTRYGTDDAVTSLLDTTTVYVIPRFDMDACEARFLTPLGEVEGTGHGVDNDRDGFFGEDGPSDVNGDGFITWMRQVDPQGIWMEDPTDARALVEADPKKGERGKWKLLVEGLDSDNDEEVAEDPPLDAVLNRNFPRNWTEHEASAGRYPTDESASLGMAEFLIEHRDIALVVTYGEEVNLAQKPNSQEDGGANRGAIKTGVYKRDLAIYEELGKRYQEATSNKAKGLGEQPGSLQSFLYHHRGLLCLDIDPWAVPLDAKSDSTEESSDGTEGDAEEEAEEAPEESDDKDDKKDAPKPGDDAKRLIWLDQNSEQAFLPWTAFEHPQLGAVEIGGFLPYSKVEPPAAQLAEVTEKHFDFFLTLGAYLPRLELLEVEGKQLGEGLVEVTAVLENGALFPQQTRAAERRRAIRPARVWLTLPEGAELVGGRVQELVSNLAGSGGRREFHWLVAGVTADGQIQIDVDTDNAGKLSALVEVK